MLKVHHALLALIAAFLTNRYQAVRIGGTLSNCKTLKGGVPQGTKLGIILSTVMTIKLLSDWRLLVKFVDDTSGLEIIPRNSTAVSYIHNFSIAHNTKLNPAKCKEMLINFLHKSEVLLRPILIGNNVIDQGVTSYKILGVFVFSVLKWNSHVDYIF